MPGQNNLQKTLLRALVPGLLGLAFASSAADALRITEPLTYSGMCDASGGVAVSSNLFIVVSDEDNILRMYRGDKSGPPVKSFDFRQFTGQRGRSDDADLEAAARIGDRAFWIGSHGLNKTGKARPSRRTFFATDIGTTNGEITLTAVGKPCHHLLDDLLADSRFNQFHLDEAARRAPKEPNALNIEGLSATPEGHLLLGFRNPIPQGNALLIPLLNPDDVIAGAPAKFGPATLLNLGGLGIRDIVLCHDAYLIIAGPYDGGSDFKLYRWAGPGTAPTAVRVDHFNTYHPEGIIIYPQSSLERFQILSDDGARMVGDCPCKDLKDHNQQTFRSFWLAP